MAPHRELPQQQSTVHILLTHYELNMLHNTVVNLWSTNGGNIEVRTLRFNCMHMVYVCLLIPTSPMKLPLSLVYPTYTILVESTVIAADAVITVLRNSSRGGPTTGYPGAGFLASTSPRGGLNWQTPWGCKEVKQQP